MPKGLQGFQKGNQIGLGNKHCVGRKPWNKGKPWSKEVREKLSISHKGQKAWNKGVIGVWKHTEEWKIDRSNFNKKYGIKPPVVHLRDEKAPNWKGNKVGYDALHDWVRSRLGTPKTCEFCSKTDLKGRQINWANKDHSYKRNLTDWIRLCVKCHAQYDKENGLKRNKNNGDTYR